MDILQIVLIVIFIAIPVFALLISLINGFKRNIFQSLARLIMTILAIAAAVLVTKFTLPAVISSLLPQITALIDNNTVSYFLNTSAVRDVIELLSTVVIPIVFSPVYIFVSIIFSILYLIPKKLLSSASNCKRSNGALTLTEEQEYVLDNEISNDTYTMKQGRCLSWKKFILRAGSIVCSLLSTVLVLSYLAVPLNYYPKLVTNISNSTNRDIIPLEAETLVGGIYDHPVNQCYRLINEPSVLFMDRIVIDGVGDTQGTETFTVLISVIDEFSTIENGDFDYRLFYRLADILEDNKLLDEILTSTVHDIFNSWNRGEAWLEIEPVIIVNETISNKLYSKFTTCESVIPVFRAVGDAVAMQQAMNTNGTPEEIIMEVFNNLNEDTVDLIDIMLEGVLSEQVGSAGEVISVFTNSVSNVITEIKNDVNLTDEEKSEKLQNEAKSVASLVTAIQEPKNIMPDQIVSWMVDSTIISTTIQNATDNGTTRDPYNIAGEFDKSFINSVKQCLDNEGVSQESDLYKSLLAFLGK